MYNQKKKKKFIPKDPKLRQQIVMSNYSQLVVHSSKAIYTLIVDTTLFLDLQSSMIRQYHS